MSIRLNPEYQILNCLNYEMLSGQTFVGFVYISFLNFFLKKNLNFLYFLNFFSFACCQFVKATKYISFSKKFYKTVIFVNTT